MSGHGDDAQYDDDEFDDDTLDNLPASTLQALESRSYIQPLQPPIHSHLHPLPTSTLNRSPAPVLPVHSHRPYGSKGVEEEVINLDDCSHAQASSYANLRPGQRAGNQWNHQSQNTGPARASPSITHQPSYLPFNPPMPGSQMPPPLASHMNPAVPDVSALQDQIKRLQKEKDDLKKHASEAEARAQAKAGETLILRQRIESSTREYQQQIEDLRNVHVSAVEKQRAELQAVQRQREQAETDKRFLEHDLTVEATRRLPARKAHPLPNRGRTAPQEPAKSTATASPKRSKTLLPCGDGFDDDIVPPPSPSRNRSDPSNSFRPLDHSVLEPIPPPSPVKSLHGSIMATPNKRPEKRRKRSDQSPVVQNELSFQEQAPEFSPIQLFSPAPSFDRQDGTLVSLDSSFNLDLMKSLLDYKVETGERFFDLMAKQSFSSNPGYLLSTIIFDRWTVGSSLGDDIALQFCNIICDLWDESLKEMLYTTVNSFIDVLYFTTSKKPAIFSQRMVARILPPALKSINLVAFPVASDADVLSSKSGSATLQINAHACLELLLSISQACEGSMEASTLFWSSISLHWTLVLLYPAQPLEQRSIMCDLLRTSLTGTSFGPILQSEETDSVRDQADLEFYLIDRLTSLLSHDSLSYSRPEEESRIDHVMAFRLNVLITLRCMCTLPRDPTALRTHPTAIGRLIQCLHSSVELLYDQRTLPHKPHELTVSCVNTAVGLIHMILKGYYTKIDLREKLQSIEGGLHTHVIALSRVAFGEFVLFEAGIDAAVADAAHDLLDEFLTKPEGKEILKMFPSADSTALGSECVGIMDLAEVGSDGHEDAAAAEVGYDEKMDMG
jgi:hypothetical protein